MAIQVFVPSFAGSSLFLRSQERNFAAKKIQRYSSFTQLVSVITWVFCRVTRSHLFSSTSLSANELSKAKVWLFKQAQGQSFSDTVEKLKKGKALPLPNPLQPLNPFLDADGLLRVGERLSHSHKAYHSRHPVILHGKLCQALTQHF